MGTSGICSQLVRNAGGLKTPELASSILSKGSLIRSLAL